MMKTLLWIVGGVAVAVAALWFAGARGTERVMAGWLEDRAAEGWVVNYDAIRTEGFPTRFQTTITALDLADPATGLAWQAPDFTLTQRALRPDHIRADWPMTQSIASPFERVSVTADALWADIDVQPTANLALDASTTVMRGVVFDSNLGWQTTLETGQLDVTRHDGATAGYDVVFEARGMVPPAAITTRLDPGGLLPEAIALTRYDAAMVFDRPWDLSALETARPQITALDLHEARAEWGALLFRASGEVAVDDAGRMTGSVAIRAENWREMLDMSVRAGVLSAGLRDVVETTLGFVAGLSGRPEDIDTTLRFDDGFAFFGPIPIGEAPRLVLR
jgi:hypothetical protein